MQVFIANNEVMFINTQLRKSPFGEIFLDPNSDILIEIRKQEEEKVNFLEKIFLQKRKNTKTLSLDEAARILKANPKFLDKFEEMYRKAGSSENDSNNLFDINAKQAAEEKEGILSNGCSQDIIDRIVDELLSQTVVWKFDGKRVNGTLDTKSLPETDAKVLKEELLKISKDVRPQFTGTFVAKDMKESSSEIVYLMLQKYMEANAAGDEQKAASFYGMFRQGLDILDMDSGLYDMIGCNRNSMGYWLPKMIQPVLDRGFLKIPATTIIKVPLTLLQLTRLDYMSFNRATLDIVDAYCRKAFELSEDKDYLSKPEPILPNLIFVMRMYVVQKKFGNWENICYLSTGRRCRWLLPRQFRILSTVFLPQMNGWSANLFRIRKIIPQFTKGCRFIQNIAYSLTLT